MKKFLRVALIILSLAAVALTATACSSVDSVYIEDADMPRVLYVQGQDLDLSGGSLTVVDGSKTAKVDLTSSGVSVSGYDKNKVGEQTVTVTYRGKSTEFAVNVIAQLVAENYQTDYFTGDDFNSSRGRLTVARDDGTLFAVSMSDSEVSVKGFDSSAAGTVTLTVEYRGSVGTFDVKIHAIGSLGITAPTKKSYYSHEIGGLSLAGGSITVKSEDGTYSSKIALADLPAESFVGFNLSAASEVNMTKPLSQTVTVSYGGKKCEFAINITYSSVSCIKASAAQFNNTDWTELPEVGEQQGKDALNAVERYETLSAIDKLYVSADEINALARAAAIYGLQAWKSEIAEYSDVFTLTSGGNINLIAETADATKAAYDKLIKADEPVVVLSKLLPYISEKFSSVALGDTTVGEYLGEVSSVDFGALTATLNYMLNLNDKIATYKASGWTDADIRGITNYMILSKRVSASDTAAYIIVAEKWNGVDNFFDMLFDYCYKLNDAGTLNGIKGLYLPGKVGELYNEIINVSVESMLMSYRIRYDATWFLIYYNRAVALINELSETDDAMQKWMFDNLDYNGSSLVALLGSQETSTYGYFKICGNALYAHNVYDFLNEYLSVMEDYLEFTDNNSGRYWNDTANANKIIALWNSFVNLTPMEQMEFLGVINSYYADYGLPDYALDFSSGSYTQFVYLVANCYSVVLGDDAFDVFADVMLATEKLSRKTLDKDGATLLSDAMSALEGKIAALSDDGLSKYDSYVKPAYEVLKARYDFAASDEPADLGEWQETFDALADAIARIQFAYALINRAAPNNYNLYSALFSAYETAAYLSNLILNSGNEAVINAYYYKAYTVTLLGYAETVTVEWPLDYGMWVMRTVYASYQLNLSVAGVRLLYLYDNDMREIMRAADPVIWWGVYASFTNMPEYTVDAKVLNNTMTAYRNLDAIHKTLFSALDANYNLYYRGVRVAYQNIISSESAALVAEKLVIAELAYTDYERSPEGADSQGASYLSKFIAAAQDLKSAYEALDEDDKAQFDACLKSAYDFYIQAYGELSE